MKRIKFNKLLNFSEKLFLKKPILINKIVKSVSYGLCETWLRGVDSHGIRLIPHYIESALKGRKTQDQKYKFYSFSSFWIS